MWRAARGRNSEPFWSHRFWVTNQRERGRGRRGPRSPARIKAVRGHSPSTVLHPVFLNLNLLFARRSSFGSSVSRGSLINLCRVLQRPGKRGGSFLLVVGVTSGEANPHAALHGQNFRRGKLHEVGSRNQINKIFAAVISIPIKTREVNYIVKIPDIIGDSAFEKVKSSARLQLFLADRVFRNRVYRRYLSCPKQYLSAHFVENIKLSQQRDACIDD